jgi:hypothetical protein
VNRGRFWKSARPPKLTCTFEARDLCAHVQHIEARGIDCNGAISLAPELGDMHFGSFTEAATLMHALPRAPVKLKRGGMLRVPVIEPTALDMIAAALAACEPGRGLITLGLPRKRTTCSLMLAPDALVSRMTAQKDVKLLRTLQEARSTPFRVLQESRLIVLSFDTSLDMWAEMRAWENVAVETFAQASARAGGAEAGLAMSFSLEDKARYFAARCPGRNWVIPFGLIQWKRLIVVLNTIEAGDARGFHADAVWTVQQDPAAALRPPNWYATLCAATALGLPEPSAHHPRMFAALAEASISVSQEMAVHPRVTCLSVHMCEHERAVRRAIESVDQRPQTPEVGFRLALGMHPSAMSFEKMVAAVHGMPAARLSNLLNMFAANASTDYAKETLQRLQRGEGGDCCVCMSEPATILTFCGHVYCAACVQELWTGVSPDSTVKCCVCRTQNFQDDWWRTLPKEHEFRETALMRELHRLRAESTGADGPRPLLVAVPSLSEAAALMGRLSHSLADGSAVLVSSLDDDGARASLVAALARAGVQMVVCPITDISHAALVTAHVQSLVLLGTHLPCQITEFSGGGRAYAYKPWLHAAVELVHGWAPPLAAEGLGVHLVSLCADPEQKGDKLAEQLREHFFCANEGEPTRAPIKYDLRSGKRHSRACLGSAL